MKKNLLAGGILLFAVAAMGLSTPLAMLDDAVVTCGATATQIGGTAVRAGSMYISNKSATCVRVGGSGVTTSTGAKIGAGCHDGPGISVDAKLAWCVAEAATVDVDVIYGRQ